VHLLGRVLPKSSLGQARAYLLNPGEVVAVCQHGRGRLANNLIENVIWPAGLGKKNGLFIGPPEAGQPSAIIYPPACRASATASIRSSSSKIGSPGIRR
jgi:hypothetical protein